MGRKKIWFWILILNLWLGILFGDGVVAQRQSEFQIGVIQGVRSASEFIGQEVTFRGVVTGIMADQNSSGAVFHTFFVQDLPGAEDADPLSSDGIAVFAGIRVPSVKPGDVVLVSGEVTEFFGLTEIDDAGLEVAVQSTGFPLPEPLLIDPPADNEAAAAYFEPLEGMRVAMPEANVVGPTFGGCSFAVAHGPSRLIRQTISDSTGQIVNILHTTDVDCEGFPSVNVGDRVGGLVGPLTYHFDQFKIVQQDPEKLVIMPDSDVVISEPPFAAEGQISVGTFNVENYFDMVDDTGDDAEPKPTATELATKQAKLIHVISRALSCPILLGIQEVENAALLEILADQLSGLCGFKYQISHRETFDSRGIDVALLSDPNRVSVRDVAQRQTCSRVDTDTFDPTIDCRIGDEPLFSRPPLQVALEVEGQPLTVFVNHFKSKRGGELETAEQRLAQGRHLHDLVLSILAEDASAAVIVMGDFNDYELSPTLMAMTEDGVLFNSLSGVPLESRYSYIFSGASQLLDSILVSPILADEIISATIAHTNADFAHTLSKDTSPEGLIYRTSDHDIPIVLLQLTEVPETEATPFNTGALSSETLNSTPESSGRPDTGVTLFPLIGLIVAGMIILGGILIWRRYRS